MIRFASVGIVNTVLTLGVIYILYMLEFNYLFANWVGYFLGFVTSFVLNKMWTFKSEGYVIRQLVLFLAMFGVCYLLQLGALVLLNRVAGLGLAVSQVLAMCVYTGFNFLGNKFITFRSWSPR